MSSVHSRKLLFLSSANLPPTLAKSQVSSVRKNLKLHLLNVLKHPASLEFQAQITTLLVDLGTPQAEIARNMPSSKDARKRPRDDSDSSLKKMKLEPNLGEDDEDKDLEPGPSGTSKVSAQISGQSDTDITAEFLQPLLTPDNVANLVRKGGGCSPQGREEGPVVLFLTPVHTPHLSRCRPSQP